jgi:hypothetical protein
VTSKLPPFLHGPGIFLQEPSIYCCAEGGISKLIDLMTIKDRGIMKAGDTFFSKSEK